MKNLPLVTIIVPAYNAHKYIRTALESAFQQTYKNIEIIVVDDGSQDETGEVVQLFGSRLTYIKQANKGVAGARNTGLKKARGEYIAFLDADDFYLPRKIEHQLGFLLAHPEFDFVYCNMKHFYDDNPAVLYQHKGPFYSGDVFEKLLHQFFGQMNTMLFPRKILDHVGFFDESSHHSEEWDIMLRIARAGYKLGFLDEDLVRIRMSRGSLSRIENQWGMKEHNVAVFEKLFQSMSSQDRKKYGADLILEKLKIKLAIAYLVAGRKKDFKKALFASTKNKLKRFLCILVVVVVFLVPTFFWKFSITQLWVFKHKQLFQKV